MSKFFAVFKFEFNKYLKSKTFILLTLVLVLIIGGLLSFPRIQEALQSDEGEPGNPGEPVVSADREPFGVVNQAGFDSERVLAKLSGALGGYEFELLEIDQEAGMELVDSGEYAYVVYLDGGNHFTLVTDSVAMQDRVYYVVDGVLLSEYRTILLAEQGVSADQTDSILGTWMESELVETGKSQANTFFYTYAIVFMLYMAILLYGQLVATSVASEKSSRAMEVLITTVSPVRMMFGKVLGTGSAALLQLFAIIGSGVFFYNFNADYWMGNDIIRSVFDIPVSTMLVSFVLFILGFFLYAFIYAAIGSLASRVEDINSSSLPVTFSMIAAFFITMFSMGAGRMDSALIKICSYIPLTSPMVLVARFSMTDMPVIEMILSLSVLLVTTVGIGWLAATIYRMGVLLYGNPPKLRGIVKLLRNQ